MNYPNDKTKKLFKPFFELSDYLLGKLNVLGYTDYDLYRKLVDDCLSSFYGTEKLSVNRTMREYRTISIFIYKIDPNMLFSCFCKSFHDNITGNNKELFMTYILCDAISNESDFDKCINECLKAYSTITYTEKTHSDLLRLIVVLRNRKYIPDYINYNTGVNLTNRFINYLESLILLNVMQANQTQKKKKTIKMIRRMNMINNYKNPTYVLHIKINDEKEIINEFLNVVNNEKKMKLAHDLTEIGLFKSGEYINNEDYLFLVNENNEGYFWINSDGKTRDFKREDLLNVISICKKRKLSNKKYHIVSSGFLYYNNSIDCIKTNVFC